MMALAMLMLAATFTRPMERIVTTDPAMVQSAYDLRAMKLLCQTVLTIDYEARPYKLIPDACELPEVSADGLTYRLRLRSPDLTAADVVRAMTRLADPAMPNGYLVKNVERAEARDARTVEVRLKRRQHVFPWMLALVGVLKADGSGTGPFVLSSWRKNHEMVFKRRKKVEKLGGQRNFNLHCPPPPSTSTLFDTVRYLTVDDASTQWLMFLKGEVDMLGDVSRDNWDSVVTADGKLNPRLAADGVRLCETPLLDSMYLGINMEDPVLGKNRKLRQALNCAFDFPAWAKFYHNSIERSDGPIPHGVDGRLETPFAYAFDLEKAKRLMAEAGYPGGIDPQTGRRLVLTLSIGKASQESREAGELTAAFFERIGVKLELAFMTWDAFLKAMNERRCQLFRIGWVGDYPDAENFLQLFHSANVSPGANHANYVNPEFDREYDAAMACATAEERNAHWRKCQEIIREDCPWVFTHYPKSYSLIRQRVGNYIPGAFPYGVEQYFEERDEGSGMRNEKTGK